MAPRLLPVLSALTGLAAAGTLTALSPAAGSSADAPRPPSAAPADSALVTLVTGDVVRLDTLASGSQQASVVRSASPGGAHIYSEDGDVHVEPMSAEPLLAAGRLDSRLFDVSSLVRQGYDDGHRGTLPLILSYRSGAGLAPSETPAGTRTRMAIPGARALAVTETKKEGATFLSALSDRHDVTKVWLDAKVTAVDPAPERATVAAGSSAAAMTAYDGTGVTIGILDSGIDPTHPDFAGRIDAMKDFTGGDDPRDGWGSGTHEASIAAGSGAASGGKYQGVAPGAHLVVGKVLDDSDYGQESWAIAGMQWAAESGADIVDVNVAGPITTGDDPLTAAVDTLSDQYGTLFVIPTGNFPAVEGNTPEVTAPAAAAAALTVGGTDKGGGWWTFSRHGVMGDRGALKPEVVARAINVVGAAPGGGYSIETSTNSAAAYASGAAALLLQEHPGWSRDQVKAQLASTADPVRDQDVFAVGAGAIDTARATGQRVTADQGVLGFGYLARPYRPDQLRQQRTIGYTNNSDTAVTLDLSTDLKGLTVRPSTLTLEPGASGSATVDLDATDLPARDYAGTVTATGGDVTVSTAVGFVKQDDTVLVTFRAIDRNGEPATGPVRVSAYQQLDGRYHSEYIHFSPDQRERTLRLPEGDYNVYGVLDTFGSSGYTPTDVSIVGDPRLSVHAPDFAVTLDARTARPMTLTAPKRTVPHAVAVRWSRGDFGNPAATYDDLQYDLATGQPPRISVTPTEPVDDAAFSLTSTWDMGLPLVTATAPGGPVSAAYDKGPLVAGRHRFPLADAADPAGVRGALAVVEVPPNGSVDDLVTKLRIKGAAAVAVYPATDDVVAPVPSDPAVLVLALPRRDGLRLRSLAHGPGEPRLDVTETPQTPYAYDVGFREDGQIAEDLAYRVQDSDLATLTTKVYSSGTGTGEAGSIANETDWHSCHCGTAAVSDAVPAPGYTRTQYVTAGSDVQASTAWVYNTRHAMVRPREFPSRRPGEHATLEFLKAPLSPGVAGGTEPNSQLPTYRNGDEIEIHYAPFTDAAGNWSLTLPGSSTTTALYAGHTLIYSAPYAGGRPAVPAAETDYRLVSDMTNDGSVVGLTTAAHTEWTFHSGHVPDDVAAPLPLLDVDYTDVVEARSGRSVLDLANTAPRGKPVAVDLTVGHQPGSIAGAIDTVAASVSFDDGRSWQPAPVRRLADGRYQATYVHPAHGDLVSLRVKATDVDGNSIDQTLIDAYRLG